MKTKTADTRPSLLALLIPAPFLAVGVFVWCLSIPWWGLYHRSEHWDRVEVTVTATSRKFNGIANHGDFVYHAEYEFSYAGRPWHGNRISITDHYPPEEFDRMCD